jgi:acetylornithine deacetylase/succinyl-diaminopimelate desuccinylase-like protein
MNDDFLSNLPDYLKSNRATFEDWLAKLVAEPTVSADKAYAKSIENGARLAADFLKQAGFKSRVIPTAGNPVVFGELTQNPKYPTVLIYNHLDVQPAEDDGSWETDPFKMTKQDDKYIGRGTTDDKGPALTALFAAKYALENKVPLNFKIVWETEEEVGSPHFEEFVGKHRQDLKAESAIVSDSIWIDSGKPTIPTGLRGMMAFELKLKTAEKDTHSGLTGGVARNPLAELAQVITDCYDASTGRVKIPEFYDAVRPVTSKEADNFLASGFDVKKFKRDHELDALITENKLDVMLRIMAEPTFEVHGIRGGYTGPGVKAIIPPEATAKLSVRLVPDQKPDDIFELIKDFIQSRHPNVDVSLYAKVQPYLVDVEGSYAHAAEVASQYAFGVKPAFIREGGSIGAVISMNRLLKLPIMLIGLSLPEHGYHAPNERYDWRQASGGMKMFAAYFAEIAKLHPVK